MLLVFPEVVVTYTDPSACTLTVIETAEASSTAHHVSPGGGAAEEKPRALCSGVKPYLRVING